jgi:hypothetical protein
MNIWSHNSSFFHITSFLILTNHIITDAEASICSKDNERINEQEVKNCKKERKKERKEEKANIS